MDIKSGLFYAFSAVLLFAAFRVVTARNPVHAVLYLVLTFFQAAGLWLLLKAEFLAITLILVYVGAVMVLFLFVVMMLDVDSNALREGFWKHFPLAATLGAVIALEMVMVLMAGFRLTDEPKTTASVLNAATTASGNPVPYSNTKELGKLLYSHYLLPIQIAACILLVAMVAAIALTLRQRKDSKHVSPSIQVRAKARERLQLVSVPTVVQAPPAPSGVASDSSGQEKHA